MSVEQRKMEKKIEKEIKSAKSNYTIEFLTCRRGWA